MLFVYILRLLAQTTFEKLVKSDLDKNETFLIYIYFSNPGFKCPTCSYFDDFLKDQNIPLKALNFCEEMSLGSQFLSFTFPVFVLRHKKRSYYLEPSSGDDLINALKKEIWNEMKPVSSFLEVNTLTNKIISYLHIFFFNFIMKANFLISNVPDSVMSIFVIFIITYLIYSIIEIFREPNEKVKTE